MKSPLTIEGRWWIEGVEKAPHFGILNYEPSSGLKLVVKIPQEVDVGESLGAFSNFSLPVPGSIFGRDQHNHPVSLYGCYIINSSSSGGLISYTVSAMMGLLGRQVENWEDVSFDHINAEFSLLHNWMALSRISVQSESGTQVKVADQEPIEAEIDPHAKLVIWPTLNLNQDNSKVILSEGYGVQFRFTGSRPVKEILRKYVQSFRRFLTLFINRPVFVDKVYFQPKDGVAAGQVMLLHSNPGVESADRNMLFPEMLVSYRDISRNFGEVIQRWFALENSLGDVLNLFFATVFVPELYMHQTFLFLAQALEVYHRTSPRFENQIQPRADFRARKASIIDKVPDEKDWLTKKLAHANEKTLAQRLEELLVLHNDKIDQFIDDPKTFSDSVRHTRNHYTHYGTEEKDIEKVAKGTELMDLTAKMQTLLEICIFEDLGIYGEPTARMIHRLKQRRYFQI